ncbi:MAG: cellulase family glycosylhydrolase [Marmoricola sp.]
MKKVALTALLSVLLSVVAVGLTVGPASADDAAVPRLQREGRNTVDQYGRIVIVHGLNMVWKSAPYAPPNTAAGFTTADADWLKTYGFNGARLGILWAGVTPNAPGVADPTYFAKWDRVVNLLADRGIWMQFDAHQDQWNEVYGGEGAPAWASKRPFPYSLLPYPSFVPFPEGYWTPEVSTVFDNFYANKGGVQDGWVAFWKLVAQHYKNQPYSAGYDLINEPWAGLEWPFCLTGGCGQTYKKELQPLMERGLAAVRSEDPKNIVWFEPQQFFGGLKLPTYLAAVPGEQNLGFSWHNYCSAVFLESLGVPFTSTDSCKAYTQNREDVANAQATTMNAASMMTEWGATDNVKAVAIDADGADANQMGWMYWAYKYWNDPTTADTAQGLFTNDADLTSTKNDKLRQLVRTYPQATAGTDLRYRYDATSGLFTMSYKANPAIAAPTRIFVSPLTAPHGYTVTSSAGTVTRSGSYVDIAVDQSTPVTVTITPLP